MDIYFDDECSVITDAEKQLITNVITEGIKQQSVNDDYELSVCIVGTDEISAMNFSYRNKVGPTDVLSFPAEPIRGMSPQPLGDIVICLDVAKMQAAEYGHSLTRELAFLTAHGLMHLLGFDHDEPAKETAMIAAQESILNALGILR